MTKYLSIAVLIFGFLMAGNAYGEDEVYYCAEIDSNGFIFDKERGSYVRAGFISNRFKMKFDKVKMLVTLRGEGVFANDYDCTVPIKWKQNMLSCTFQFHKFNFNTENNRFTYINEVGYVVNDSPVYVSFGTCDKF